MKLTVGIPVFNGVEYLRNLLDSLELALKDVDFLYEVIVVDDGSTEDVKGVVESFPSLPLVLHTFTENMGTAHAFNKILETMQGDFLFRLDADTVVNKEAVAGLLAYMQMNTNVGAVVAKLIGPKGDNQSTVEMTFKEPYEWVSDYALWLKKIFRKKLNILDTIHQPTQIAYAGTGAIMIRREVIEAIGMLDTDIQFFMEDADYVWRITKAAWKVMYHPGFQVLHIGGHSGVLYIHMRLISLTNLHKFYLKHRPGKTNQIILDISILLGTSVSVLLLIPAIPLYIAPQFKTILVRAYTSYLSVYRWYWQRWFGAR